VGQDSGTQLGQKIELFDQFDPLKPLLTSLKNRCPPHDSEKLRAIDEKGGIHGGLKERLTSMRQ
jgi:hypothetical protein